MCDLVELTWVQHCPQAGKQPWWCGKRRSVVLGSAWVWPRSLSPAWCLAVLYGASLAQIGSSCTQFTPFPNFYLGKIRVRIFCNSCFFFFSPPDTVRQHPWNLCFISDCLLKKQMECKDFAFLFYGKTGLEEYAPLKGSHSSSWYCCKRCQEMELKYGRNLKNASSLLLNWRMKLTVQHLQSVSGQ